MITRRQDCYRKISTSNMRIYALILGSQRQKAKAYEDEGGNKRQHLLKKINDHVEESEPDLFLLLSCHFQLEEFGRGHGRGRLSCGHLSWGLDSSSYQGTYFSSSYHDRPYPYLFPCPYPYPYPYRLSRIVDEGCEIVRDRGQSDEKALPEVEYVCHSAKRRTADSWPTEKNVSI